MKSTRWHCTGACCSTSYQSASHYLSNSICGDAIHAFISVVAWALAALEPPPPTHTPNAPHPFRLRGARVMWDVVTGRTKAYGFASFRSREDAQVAIDAMQGQVVGSRQIRCGWAQHKQVGYCYTDVLPASQFQPRLTS